jgi:Flp pilus assembly CpaF family ATPase
MWRAPTAEQIADMTEDLRVVSRTGRLDQWWQCSPDDAFARIGVGSDWTEREWAHLAWYGPLEGWRQPGTTVSDILINGPNAPLYIVDRGVMLNTNLVLHPGWIDWLQRQLLLRSNKLRPHVIPGAEATAPMMQGVADRLRFALTRVPATPAGGSIAIRVLPERWRTAGDLITEGVLPADAVDLLVTALKGGASILVAGATGSGKTTLAAALLQAPGIGDAARVVFVEDGGELPVTANSVHIDVSAGEQAFGRAVTFTLRMKPQYLVVGEVRGGEAMALLQAAATGHPGIGTIHATDVSVALRNLERMAMLGLASEASGGGQAAAMIVRGLMTSPAVALTVVHIGQTPSGRRSVLHIAEVLPLGAQGNSGDRFPCNDLYQFDPARDQLVRCGYVQAAWGVGRY